MEMIGNNELDNTNFIKYNKEKIKEVILCH